MTEVPPGSAGSSSPRASSVAATSLSSAVPKDVLIVDFGQQCTNLQNQYTRMHGRMQLITGLLPALGALAVAAGRDDVGQGWLLLFPAAGLLLSMIGYVAGAADRHLVVLYRKQLARTAESLLVSTRVADPKVYVTWAHAGRDPVEVEGIVNQSAFRRLGRHERSRPWAHWGTGRSFGHCYMACGQRGVRVDVNPLSP